MRCILIGYNFLLTWLGKNISKTADASALTGLLTELEYVEKNGITAHITSSTLACNLSQLSSSATTDELSKKLEQNNITVLSLESIQQELESKLQGLEKISELEKRIRKYKSSDPAETWATRWIASPIAYLFPPERREEWLGDSYEINREMLHKHYPKWSINLVMIGRTVILITSAVQIKLSDLISLGVKRS